MSDKFLTFRINNDNKNKLFIKKSLENELARARAETNESKLLCQDMTIRMRESEIIIKTKDAELVELRSRIKAMEESVREATVRLENKNSELVELRNRVRLYTGN